VSVDLGEFVSGFLAEAEDHLRSINANLLLVDTATRQQTPNPRAVRELFRSLHTMKGLAGMVGVEPIVDLAHAMERILRDAEHNGGRLPAPAFEPLLQGTKAIAQRVSALAASKPVPDAPRELLELLDTVDAFGAGAGPSLRPLLLDENVLAKLNSSDVEQLSRPSEQRQAFQVRFSPSTERAARGLTITAVRERLAPLADIVKVIPVTSKEDGSLTFLFLVVSANTEAQLAEAAECSLEDVIRIAHAEAPSVFEERLEIDDDNDGPSAANVLRVDVRRVDAAMDGLGELLVTKFRLVRAIATLKARGVDVRELQEIVHDTQRRLRDVRALVLGLRMIALSELLDRLPILVRGLQTTTGKVAQIKMEVGRFEVDKAVGERLWPVLVHLIRNAMDHGLEAEAERLRSGKPPQGTIRVSCTRSSNSRLELKIEDDGAGIDSVRVAEQAGRAPPEDDDELLELIARPGLSTRATVTATSGRGMGLDIARRIVVEELGGELRLRTTVGEGTCFTLEVPVTVAVVDAFRCQSAAQSFLVPVASVEEFVEVEPSEIMRSPIIGLESPTRAALLSKRGKTMPFIELSTLLGGEPSGVSKKAIIVRRNEQFFAFGVDRLLGHYEVIVRRLADPLVDVPGVAGAADLGDGQPTLLLDLIALSRLHGEAERAA
jgi:two-component system chemotaxis sensor kinase CheA